MLAAVAALGGCGAPGAPQPPSLELPKPVRDLTASRKGDRVLLTWTPPTQTLDGENIRHAGNTDICRALDVSSMPKCEEKVSSVAGAQVEHWTSSTLVSRSDYTDVLPGTLQLNRPLGEATYALSDQNRNGRSAGLSNQVQVPLAPTQSPPANVDAKVTPDGVELAWDSPPPPVSSPDLHYLYRILRRSVSQPDKAEMIAGETSATEGSSATFTDHNVEWEQRYEYRIEPVTEVAPAGKPKVGVEGDDSPGVEVFVHDVFPPAVPTGVQAVFSGVGQKPFIDLTWAPDLENDLAGYNVYRHESGAPPAKINTEVVKTPAFRDEAVESGRAYYYSVSAVDQRGNESGQSEETSEKVPQP